MGTLIDQVIANAGSVSLGMLADVDHVSVNVTTQGPLMNSPSAGAADHVIRAGWIALGSELDADGTQAHSVYWREPKWLNFDQTLIAPPFDDYPSSHIRWWLSQGTQAHLFVAGVVHPMALPNTSLSPWDRNLAAWSRTAFPTINGVQSETVAWTYTVPAGKKLWLSSAKTSIRRVTASAAGGNVYASIRRGGLYIINVNYDASTIGYLADRLSGDALWLSAGEVLDAVSASSVSSGQVAIDLVASGQLFDA